MTQSDPLYHPNTKDEPEASGLYCFKDHARACGADCMAFTEPPEGQEYVGKQWARCLLLVNAHRTGKHLTIIASVVGRIEQRVGNAAADAKRTNQTPPPRPTG